ncbi:hypothetical protein GGR32_000166 [Mesonia hippocampi]|uniref:Uncharacterized protein n=1 Tax=Mesonia hippocampi TaxID=1628250 RepID=A0A840EUX8_9FLAO|nr:hypothetical protein [Mesonia hippocampi]MBB4117894.1 hypothetical protein [Mesonia hippocampi]
METELQRKTNRLKEDIAYVFKDDKQDPELCIKSSVSFGNKGIKEAKIITNIELTSLHIQKIQALITLHNFNDYRIKRSGGALRILLTK